MNRQSELSAISNHIATRGVTRALAEADNYKPPQFSKNKRADWVKGKKKSPRWRYNLALAYARNNDLGRPAWTDVLEGQLEALCALGFSYRQIAKIMNKTKAAIQARVRYLRLGRRLNRTSAALLHPRVPRVLCASSPLPIVSSGRARHRMNSSRTMEVRRLLLKRDGGRCFYCQGELSDDMTVEHLREWSDGGSDDPSNLVLAHYKCNAAVMGCSVDLKMRLHRIRA